MLLHKLVCERLSVCKEKKPCQVEKSKMDLKRTQWSAGGTSILTTCPVGWAVGTFWCLVQSKPLPSGFAPGDWLTFVLKTKQHWEFSLRALRGDSKNKACLAKGSWLVPWRTAFCRGVSIAYRWSKTENLPSQCCRNMAVWGPSDTSFFEYRCSSDGIRILVSISIISRRR